MQQQKNARWQFWAQSMPVWPVLTSLTHRQQLPPAVYVLIDAIDTTHRAHELPCNADFWLAVQQELLPLVKAIAPFSDRADRTVVAGQSFGGLSALYAGLHWPERFGCVLSQSGSYWWPHRGGQQEGVLLEKLKAGEVSAEGLRIVLEAGIMNTPSIVYDAPGCRDAVDNGKTGYLCRENTPQELARLMSQILDNPSEYASMQKVARDFSKQFSWDKSAKIFTDLILNLGKGSV